MLLKHLPASVSQSAACRAFAAELDPDRLVSSLVAGSITGMIGVIRAISYAALIFSGPLAPSLNVGVGIAVCGSALISVVVALTSSLPGMIATPLAAPTVVLAALAAAIAQRLGPGAAPGAAVTTVVAAIALGSVLTGLTLWILGQLGWGRGMEFLPYPVVGGFMAGTGLLLVRGAFKVMTGKDVSLGQLSWFCQVDQCPRWLAGLAIAAVLLWATKQFHHVLVMPVVLAAATLGFYGTIWVGQTPLATVRAQDWLLGPFPQGNLWHPLTPGNLSQVQWGVIYQAGPTLGLLVFVSLVSLVLTNGSIELAVEKDVDLNCELKAVGLANLVAGLGSTMAGNQALPSTLLVHRLGAANRMTGIVKALPCLLVLVLGPAFLNYFPKPVLGSLLLFLGLDLLWQWLYGAWFKLPVADYLIIWATLLAINTAGFIPGIGLGLGLAAMQFLVHCSRLEAVVAVGADGPQDQPTGENDPAIADLSPAVAAELRAWLDSSQGKAVATVKLRGFLFFGTAKGVCQQLCDRILYQSPAVPPLQYLILDFQQVLALDSSAAMGLSRLAKLAQDHNCTLVFCQLTESCQSLLLKSKTLAPGKNAVFADYSQAVAWCQQQLTAIAAAGTAEAAATPPQTAIKSPPVEVSLTTSGGMP
ncbi:SulP family inorganic anion transporter [Nodosilinea nodulosa]|uniref:SulP family inorganic anion transporter n=1 Tax=Nodosilinea nodulosa TaxID=416001 RepID=UPI00030EE70D|nr:SulP family inorganic anion transporter [Nodosilinea nodulosa]